MSETDAATGLPVVPDGYFWRVKTKWEEFRDVPTVIVQLRRHRKFGSSVVQSLERLAARGDREEEDSYDDIATSRYTKWRKFATPEGVLDGVYSMAEIILQAQSVSLRRESDYAALKKALDTVVGDYPPKKLEN